MAELKSFSVLLSVYIKETPSFLSQAISSIWDEQVLKPDQIVLVQDGKLTQDLHEVIDHWKETLGEVLTVVALSENVGLASALNKGLKYCKNELVARMDTDDISVPERFSKQIDFMWKNPEVVVCSGQIEEWSQDFSEKISERCLPLSHKDIVHFAKSRSPISHPAVVFRKSAVLSVGGYPNIYPEDYPLWGKMLAEEYQFSNLPDVLLKMRVGNALLERRGWSFLKGEYNVYKYLYTIGFISKVDFFKNIILRSIVRLSPALIKKFLYKYFR